MRLAAVAVLLIPSLAPRATISDAVEPVIDETGSPVVQRMLTAGDSGAGRRYVRAVRDLVEDRLDVDALASDAPIAVWTVDDELVAFEVDGHFAAEAGGGKDSEEAERWVFDDGTSLDGPMLSRPVRYLAIASRIGVREHPITHRITFHAGTDYAAPVGTPVRAAKDGVVTHYLRSWTGGNVLVIKHDDGSETKYMHLSARAPGIDEHVRVHEGQLVAFVGKTGRVTGPHLHFEVRDARGYPLDPVIARWGGAMAVTAHALDALQLRRDLLRTFHVDGTRDWESPLVEPASTIEAALADDGLHAMAVPTVAPLTRGNSRGARARKRSGFFPTGRASRNIGA